MKGIRTHTHINTHTHIHTYTHTHTHKGYIDLGSAGKAVQSEAMKKIKNKNTHILTQAKLPCLKCP